ncbi:PQQ-binding-like beta-propeller repeat protein [Novipirellula herctigrandis]|uniref:outer membrane protein assembly factor BamB family protein n=1 Tax=Novipirellula herctigrandis TaxID=2527986 RepID=UPI003AF3BE9D
MANAMQLTIAGLRHVVLALVFTTLLASARAADPSGAGLPKGFAEQWPSLRGPGGYGVGKPANTMTQWDVQTGEGILWSAKVPLAGNNSPIVWRDHVFMSGADEMRQSVFCFDANTGKQLWIKDVATSVQRPKVNKDAGLAAPTMASDGTRVFAIFATGDLVAFDFDGNLVWKKNLGLPNNPYGMGSSLISDGQRLFIQYDHRETQKVIALECHSGKPVWQKAREHISWSSPALIRAAKGLQLILNDEKNVTAYDPVTGKQLWQIECLGGEVAPSPAFNGKDILVVANEYAQATAIKLTGESPRIMWHYDDYLPEIASPLAAGGLVFIPTSYGDVACLDETTGKELWVHHFDVDLLSSPIQVGDRIYQIDFEGTVHIFKAARSYIEVATIEMGQQVYATPAFANGCIYIRGEESLYCIRKRKPSENPFQQGSAMAKNTATKNAVPNKPAPWTPRPGDDQLATNMSWMPWDLHETLDGSLTVGQLRQFTALPSFKACLAIREDIQSRGWGFFSLEGNDFKKNKSDYYKQSNEFMSAVSKILTDEQMAGFEQAFGPGAAALNAAPMAKAVENRVAPNQNTDFPGTNWAQFMGPTRTGKSEEKGLLRKWPENGPPVLWTVNVGDGYAGPAIVGDKVYLLDREEAEQRDVFKCYDLKTGDELWQHAYDTSGKIIYPGSRTVPTIENGLAYICGGFGHLHCIDLNTQQVVWGKDLWSDFKGGELPAWGVAQNPLTYKDLVIVAVQTDIVGVVAFDKKTGDVRWTTQPLGDYSYVNPSLVTIEGEQHLTMVAAASNWRGESKSDYQGVVGIAPDSGEILWNYKNWDCGIPIPPIVDAGKNRLYVGAGYRSGCALFEVKKNKDGFATEEIFKTMDFGTHIHPPILHDGHFYAHCSDSRGRQDGLTCMSLDGEVKWQSKKSPIFNKGGFIIADDLIISVDGKFGILYLTEANPNQFTILSKVRLLDKSRCWAPLALSRGKLIIRDDKQMKCLLVK